ncbi:YutD family protein, partial [Lactobacillus salivarius]
MNSERKERREVQLAKKAETIEAAASEVLVINETRIKIDGRPYDLVENYHEGFNAERLGERFSQILTKYDYIVGDWGYDQLRLRGFYEIGSKKGSPYQSIERLDDYLYE